MGGTFITLLIVFLVLGVFFKMGPEEEAHAEEAAAEPEAAPAADAPAPPEPPAGSGGEQDAFKAP